VRRGIVSIWCGLCVFLGALGAHAAVGPMDTVAPDSFWFAKLTYTVPPGATNVQISIGFQPGDRGYSGSVEYFTRDSEARDGVDYLGSSGRVHFSGVPEQSIEIPILQSASNSGLKTFLVFLAHPTAFLWNNPAAVVIECAPQLQWAAQDGKLVLSWPGECTEYILETSAKPDCSDAAPAASAPILVNGRWQVVEPASGKVRFYRLRKD
jgi:hypothetical protein